jgi:hypothetical protein
MTVICANGQALRAGTPSPAMSAFEAKADIRDLAIDVRC